MEVEKYSRILINHLWIIYNIYYSEFELFGVPVIALH